LLDAVVEFSAVRGIPVAMHLAESPEELELLQSGGGPLRTLMEEMDAWDGSLVQRPMRPMDFLRRLAECHRALVVHGNYLDDEEIGFLGGHAARMSVVYCPRSHDWFSHRTYPLEKMLSAGVVVALGTDGRGSSPDLSLWAEMQRAARRHPGVGRDRILRMGTLSGARALGLADQFGSIAPGRRAELSVVALSGRNASDPHELLFDVTRLGRSRQKCYPLRLDTRP
jgi:aminodeoxyfutalosine deaminase